SLTKWSGFPQKYDHFVRDYPERSGQRRGVGDGLLGTTHGVTPDRTVLVAGATGFIGRRLVPVLVEAGYAVRAMTRRPDEYAGPGQAVGGEVPAHPPLGTRVE